MKYLKKYENSEEDKPDFKEGDYVICMDSEDSVLTEEMRYLVKKLFKNKRGYYVCKVESRLGGIGEKFGTFSCGRFTSELKHDVKQFNI